MIVVFAAATDNNGYPCAQYLDLSEMDREGDRRSGLVRVAKELAAHLPWDLRQRLLFELELEGVGYVLPELTEALDLAGGPPCDR